MAGLGRFVPFFVEKLFPIDLQGRQRVRSNGVGSRGVGVVHLVASAGPHSGDRVQRSHRQVLVSQSTWGPDERQIQSQHVALLSRGKGKVGTPNRSLISIML